MTTRDEYIEKAKDKLDVLNADLKKLEARADEASGNVKQELKNELDGIRQSKRDADAKLQELRSASDSAWEDLKAGAESAWRSLSQSIDRATQRFGQ